MAITSNQKLLTVRTPGIGGGLYNASTELVALMEQYENARIVSLVSSPVPNPLGQGQIAVELLAVIEHD